MRCARCCAHDLSQFLWQVVQQNLSCPFRSRFTLCGRDGLNALRLSLGDNDGDPPAHLFTKNRLGARFRFCFRHPVHPLFEYSQTYNSSTLLSVVRKYQFLVTHFDSGGLRLLYSVSIVATGSPREAVLVRGLTVNEKSRRGPVRDFNSGLKPRRLDRLTEWAFLDLRSLDPCANVCHARPQFESETRALSNSSACRTNSMGLMWGSGIKLLSIPAQDDFP